MGKYGEVYVAFDTAKLKHSVALAEGGRQGELRFVGEIASQRSAPLPCSAAPA